MGWGDVHRTHLVHAGCGSVRTYPLPTRMVRRSDIVFVRVNALLFSHVSRVHRVRDELARQAFVKVQESKQLHRLRMISATTTQTSSLNASAKVGTTEDVAHSEKARPSKKSKKTKPKKNS